MEEQLVSFETAKLAKEKGLMNGLFCNAQYCVGFKIIKEDKNIIKLSYFINSVESKFHLGLVEALNLIK